MSNLEEGTGTLVVERLFPHAAEKVWRALTESSLLAQWLMANDFEAAPGRRFQFRREPVANWNGVIDCEVLIMEPLKRLVYSWTAVGVDTVVTFTLTPAEEGTRLRMEQSGFRADQRSAYQGAGYGWRNFMDGLERLLGGGME